MRKLGGGGAPRGDRQLGACGRRRRVDAVRLETLQLVARPVGRPSTVRVMAGEMVSAAP